MIAHAMLPVGDYEKGKAFYKQVLQPLGYTMNMDHPEWKAGGYNDGKNTDFWIAEKKAPAEHVAFEAKNKEAVDGFYQAGLAAGGTDNGAPGYRKEYWPGYYAAFIHDLDGNNVEAVWYDYDAK
jgi:predicted lactoylglutathione lyase